MTGLLVTRIAFGGCAIALIAAVVLLSLLKALDYNIFPYKWPMVFYGGLDMIALCLIAPFWYAAEQDHKLKSGLERHG